MAKIKILHIIKSLGRGGAEMLLPETLKLHDREKFDFHYIYFLPWKDQMVGAIREAGGTVQCIAAGNNIAIALRLADVRAYIRRHEIRLVHCHLPWAGFVGRALHRFYRIPVIYSEHNVQERYHGVTKLINRLTFNWQSTAIAVSADVHESIVTNIHPRIPVVTILNGVNTERFRRSSADGMVIRSKLGIAADAVVIGSVAVFRPQKRLLEWMEVAKKISGDFPKVVFVLVGDGSLKQELLERRKSLGLENSVIMPGLQENVLPWLSSFDIYMMSSQFEGLPLALLEAMSMECAVVSTDAGGIKEVIRDRVDGLLVPVQSPETLSTRIEELITNNAFRASLSKSARARVEESFSLKKMVIDLERIYTGFTEQA